jgi:hypothetical protein
MKLIRHSKMKSENLDWGEVIAPNKHADFWHHEITDSASEVYIGVIHDDGAVETVYAKWDSVDTFAHFQVRPVMYHNSGHVQKTLHWNPDTDQLFCERNSCETSIYRVTRAELVELFLSVREDDKIELLKMEDVRTSPPAEPKHQIERGSAAEFPPFEDWLIKRLSESALAHAADSKEFVQKLIEYIKSRSSASAK